MPALTVSRFHQLYRCQVNVSPRRSCQRIIAKLKVIVSGRSQPSDLVWAANDRRSVRQSTGAGLFRVRYKNRLIDFRVSIMPTIHGEDAVLRVLDKESMSEKFAKLSLDVVG